MKLPAKWKRERTASLQALGIADYVDYLASPLWARIRRRVYARANGTCESCKRCHPTAIHHWSYALETMRGQTLKHLRAVCAACHKRHHGLKKANGKKAARRRRNRERKAWMASGAAIGQPVRHVPRLVREPRGMAGIYPEDMHG